MWKSSSNKTLLALLIISIAITILSGAYWKFWFILPFTLLNLWILDSMFFERNAFMFEPNLHYWKEANETEY